MTPAQARPAGWKNYDDFAAGIATNRLPASDAFVGQTLALQFEGCSLTLSFKARHELAGTETGARVDSGLDWCEAIEVAPDTFFIDITFTSRPQHALTVIVN